MLPCISIMYTLIAQIGIDLIGPLPESQAGNKYILTVIDYFSKWAEAFPLPDKSAVGVGQCLFTTICRYV